MKNLTTLGVACFALCNAIVSANAGQVTATGPAESDWLDSDASFLTAPFNISSDGVIGGSTSFSVFYFVDDRPEQGARPFGDVIVTSGSISFSSTYLGSGATVDSSLSYGSSTPFLVSNVLQNNASVGADNYDGITYSDGSGNTYYGWLQFQLGQFQAGAVAVSFVSGYVSDTPSTPVTAGLAPVPEPATLALAGLGGLALFLRKRK